MNRLNADLHCHSTVSDGTLSPEALALRAQANGVQLWSLTDHDEVAGQERARDAALRLGMAYLTGCEVSVSFAGETVHVVGLGFDPGDRTLAEGLARTRGGRERRAREMADALARVGIPGAYEGALRHAANPQLVSRTHFARYLVERGVCADTHEVFRRYLAEGKPGYVPHRWAKLEDAVGWIRAAGGVAVIAHPGRYDLTVTEEHALFSEFRALGGAAVEVVTPSHDRKEWGRYAGLARDLGLAASRGSDFHSPDESTDLGALPELPRHLTPVWELLADRVLRRP